MKKILSLCLLWAGLTIIVTAQNDLAIEYANTITEEDLRDHLSILASDALEGRETGTRGQKMAAAFIRHHFKENNLQPIVENNGAKQYYQPVELIQSKPGDIWIKIRDEQYDNFSAFAYWGNDHFEQPESVEVVFAGQGDQEDYELIDVQDKAAVILAGEGGIRRMRNKTRLARENGARTVLAVVNSTDEDFENLMMQFKSYLTGGSLRLQSEEPSNRTGLFLISPTFAASLFQTQTDKLEKAIEKANNGNKNAYNKFTNQLTYYLTRKNETVITENVLGYIEGTDKKDEVLILTSHYDHIGRQGEEINNGADDDGSGTVAILEIAQAFALAKEAGHGPRRSILFMPVSGEEKGLLGSEYYSENPVIPLENTVTNLNIDMIGRIDPNHKENPNYVYIIGSDRLSEDLHNINETANQTYTQMELDYTYNDENDPNRFYYRSDHYNFAKHNIPIIFYFNGTHPDYHQPTDTIEKISFEMLAKRAKLVFHTAWMLANRDDRVALDQQVEPATNGQDE